MLVFGLVVEGIFDRDALETLIRRIVTESQVTVLTLVAGDKKRLMRNFAGLLESFRWANEGSPVDKALVVRDSNGEDPAGVLAKLQTRLKTRSYGFPVEPLMIIQALEAWFLADETAIKQLTKQKRAQNRNPEGISGPKEALKARLAAAKILYTPVVARALAEEINLDKVARRCSSFRLFRDSLR